MFVVLVDLLWSICSYVSVVTSTEKIVSNCGWVLSAIDICKRCKKAEDPVEPVARNSDQVNDNGCSKRVYMAGKKIRAEESKA